MYKYKKIISWILIFILLFAGINWSGITTFADATDDLDLTSVNMDIDHPYAIITLRVESDVKTYNLYTSSSQIFYMSDYNRVIVKGTESEVLKYNWNNTSKSWVNTGTVTSNYNEELKVNDFLKENIYVKKISDILDNNLSDGFYVVAYGGVNDGSYFKNHNYIDYKTLNRNDFTETDTNSLNLSLSMINEDNFNIVFYPDTEGSLTPDFRTLYPKSSFVLPNVYQFSDSNGVLHTSNVSWDVSMYYVDEGNSVNINDYITFDNSTGKYIAKEDITKDVIIKIEGTF